MLAEHTTTGALTRNYVYLNGQPLALVDATGTVSYVLNDQVGQPQKMLNSSGAVSWQRVAGIFGDTVSQPFGSTSANPVRFPGQWYDANTGLHYNYFRDYDPMTGRYLETDPIGLDGGINPYVYVGGNPVNAGDPTGEFWNFVVGGATGALSGYAIAKLTGDECYDWHDALTDAALGATGAGLLSKLNKLRRIAKLRNIASSRGLQNLGRAGYTETWGGGSNSLEKLAIKFEGGKSPNLQAGSRVPRFSYRVDAGKYWDPFTRQTGPKGALSHVPLEPFNPGGSAASGAAAGGATEAACACQ
jgi:RHS repeat-associated protein